MRARNKKEKHIYHLRDQQKSLTDKQKAWGYKRLNNYVVFRYSRHVCTECGYKWQGDTEVTRKNNGCSCPKCNKELKYVALDNSSEEFVKLFSIVKVFKGFQVIRNFEFYKRVFRSGENRTSVAEVSQTWIDTDGKITYLRLNRAGNWNSCWSYHSGLEVRGNNANGYYPNSAELGMRDNQDGVYPGMKILPMFKLRGAKYISGISIVSLFEGLLKDTLTETLLKVKQYGLLQFRVHSPHRSEELKRHIMIALRHSYVVHDPMLWDDYISFMKELGKDVFNPKYLLPENLKEAHNEAHRLVEIQRDRIHAEQLEEKLKDSKEKARQLAITRRKRKKLKGFLLKARGVVARPLITKTDFKKEGKAMNHCVADYEIKPNVLVFSVSVNGTHLETTEFCLAKEKVLQSRGYDNDPSNYHNMIVKTIEKNKQKILKQIS